MRGLFAIGLAAALGLCAGCQHIPDPCVGYDLACLAVTVQSGPPDTYQLNVVVDGFGSSTPLTPRQMPDTPLVYPLRFAIRFAMFDKQFSGHVTVDVASLDQDDQVNGEARVDVAIDNTDKRQLVLTLGPPLPDLMPPPPDLASSDLAPLDLGADLGGAPDLTPEDLAAGPDGGGSD